MQKPDLQSASAPAAGQEEADPTEDELATEDMPTNAQDAEDTVAMLRELGTEVPDVNTNAVAASPFFWGAQGGQVAVGSLLD